MLPWFYWLDNLTKITFSSPTPSKKFTYYTFWYYFSSGRGRGGEGKRRKARSLQFACWAGCSALIYHVKTCHLSRLLIKLQLKISFWLAFSFIHLLFSIYRSNTEMYRHLRLKWLPAHQQLMTVLMTTMKIRVSLQPCSVSVSRLGDFFKRLVDK